MIPFITVLHLLLCVLLILVILLQPGKGGDVAAAFGAGGGGGGGGNALFGAQGPASLLSRATTVVAVLFMITSITLAVHSQDTTKGAGTELQDGVILDEEQGFDLPTFSPKEEGGAELNDG